MSLFKKAIPFIVGVVAFALVLQVSFADTTSASIPVPVCTTLTSYLHAFIPQTSGSRSPALAASVDTTATGQVHKLQAFLIASGSLDASKIASHLGTYEDLTAAAVKKFQLVKGITPDGQVGAVTRGAIQQVSCGTATTPGSYIIKQSIGTSLKMNYDTTQKETKLYGYGQITVYAGASDVRLLVSNPFNVSLNIVTDSHHDFGAYTNGQSFTMKPLSNLAIGGDNITAAKYYIIPAGKTGVFNIIGGYNAKELFAGRYTFSINSANFVKSAALQSEQIDTVDVPANVSLPVTVIGETSPYINGNGYIADSSGVVTMTGVRLKTGDVATITGAGSATFPITLNQTGTSFTFQAGSLHLSTGQYYLYVTDPSTGKSDTVSFTVTSTVSGNEGCVGTAMFSATTGKPCSNSVSTNVEPGCAPGTIYSSTTGKPCSPNPDQGCVTGATFSTTTGKPCIPVPNDGGCSTGALFNAITGASCSNQPPSTADYKVTITGTPTLALVYNTAHKESQLKATFSVRVDNNSMSSLRVYKNGLSVLLSSTQHSSATVGSLTPLSNVHLDFDGNSYIIPALKTGLFTGEAIGTPSQLFAGTYKASAQGANVITGSNQAAFVAATTNTSNAVTIIGETSPYISSVDTQAVALTPFVINGARFTPTGNVVNIKSSGYVHSFTFNAVNGTKIPVVISSPLVSGTYDITVTNSLGASNDFTFNIGGGTPTDGVSVVSNSATLTTTISGTTALTSLINATYLVAITNNTSQPVSLASTMPFATDFQVGSTIVTPVSTDILIQSTLPIVAQNLIPAGITKTYTVTVTRSAFEGLMTGMYIGHLKTVTFSDGSSLAVNNATTPAAAVMGDGTTQNHTPTITSVSPTSGLLESQATLTGTNFTSTNNDVYFGGHKISINSSSANSIVFRVPTALAPICSSTPGTMCPNNLQAVTPGVYPVKIVNANGTSNEVNYTVTARIQGPIIISLSQTTVTPSTSITITGTGFTAADNQVTLHGINGQGSIGNVYSSTNGTSISYIIPEKIYQGCDNITQNTGTVNGLASVTSCDPLVVNNPLGNYSLTVRNTNGTSNSFNLTLTAHSTTPSPSPTPGTPPSTASISGKVFNDTNSNGTMDSATGGLAGFTVKLYKSEDSSVLLGTKVTDSTGSYSFPNLAAGTYLVYVTNQPTKYTPTGKSTTYYQINLAAGAASTANNFGEHDISAITMACAALNPEPTFLSSMEAAVRSRPASRFNLTSGMEVGQYAVNLDINNDHLVNVTDEIAVRNSIAAGSSIAKMQPIFAKLIAAAQARVGLHTTDGGYIAQFDINADGVINASDVAQMQAKFNEYQTDFAICYPSNVAALGGTKTQQQAAILDAIRALYNQLLGL